MSFLKITVQNLYIFIFDRCRLYGAHYSGCALLAGLDGYAVLRDPHFENGPGRTALEPVESRECMQTVVPELLYLYSTVKAL